MGFIHSISYVFCNDSLSAIVCTVILKQQNWKVIAKRKQEKDQIKPLYVLASLVVTNSLVAI